MMIVQAASSSVTDDIGVGTAFLVGLIVGIVIVFRVVKAVRAEYDKRPESPDAVKSKE